MLRTRALEVSLWEAVLPGEVLRLPEELARVDVLLDESGVLRPVHAVLRPAAGTPVDADGGLPAVDVPQVPLPVGLRDSVPRGRGFDHLAAVLPDPDRRAGAASDHADEAHHPLRH